jgi:DNA-binding CsgD family transcriptional regulator
MSLFERLLLTYRLFPEQIIRLEANLFLMLADIAAAQDKSVSAFVSEALYRVVYENHAETKNDFRWETLTPREQQVAALACLGYTNSEIARYLIISINTVRSHIRNILEKYQVSSKAELRLMLAQWDFQTWLESQRLVESAFNSESSPRTRLVK